MESLVRRFYEKYVLVSTEYVFDFIKQADWSKRFIGIKGSRGVGKTTLLLQFIRVNYKSNGKVLFSSLDNLFFTENRLYDLADIFYKEGGELLVRGVVQTPTRQGPLSGGICMMVFPN